MAAPTFILKYEDIPKENLWYRQTYSLPVTEFITVGEYEIPLPDKPKKELFQNFGKPVEEQVFRKILMPDDFFLWNNGQKEHFVKYMWHLRFNGEWWLIGGEEVFINGYFWFFLNWWKLNIGSYAEYREEALEFFELWRYALNSPHIYGILGTKARRVGDTEKALCIPFDFCTRHRNMWAGMQNVNEKAAKGDFRRMVESFKAMPFFFKPQNLGGDTPREVLDFRYENLKSHENGQHYDSKQLNSRIDYKPATLRQYDGDMLNFYRIGEWGKVTNFNILDQWEIVKRSLSLNSGETIIGKCIHESTVEEMSSETLETARQLWEDSNPKKLLSNGQTTSGLIRHFRSAVLTAPVDKFGRHDKEGMEKIILEKLKNLIEQKRYGTASSFMRKNPLDIEDVFTPSADDCDLIPEILDVRKNQFKKGEDEYGNDLSVKQGQRFNLYWTDGIGSAVKAIPNLKGEFVLSQQPEHPNNWTTDESTGLNIPMDGFQYTIGLDSADHKKTEKSHGKKQSDIAASCFRHLDYNQEDLMWWDEKSKDFKDEYKYHMVTDQFVALYVGRSPEPSRDYEQVAKLAVYFGAVINCERNKPAFIRWAEDKGLTGYLYPDPDQASKRGAIEYGQNATTPNIRKGIEFLKMWVEFRWQSMWIKEQMIDMRGFTYDNRGKRDITVSMYFALLRAYRKDISRLSNMTTAAESFDLPFETFEN